MLKKTITYVDYDGKERTEDFYFNLSKAEVTAMEASEKGGLVKLIERITKEEDQKEMVRLFMDVILKAYGEKSPDGRRFMKVDENNRPLSIGFSQTEAFSNLFMELATNADAAAAFMNGIVPKPDAKQ